MSEEERIIVRIREYTPKEPRMEHRHEESKMVEALLEKMKERDLNKLITI
jgi:hypothetical protein